MRYKVHFRGKGYTAPNAQNPNGILVCGTGFLIVQGKRPARSMDIPRTVMEESKRVFMQQCQVVRFEGDAPNQENFPTVWLGKQL